MIHTYKRKSLETCIKGWKLNQNQASGWV